MAKYGNTFYLQLTRKLWTDDYKQLSLQAKWLYCTLKEVEQRYCGNGNNRDSYFFRTDKQLSEDSGLPLRTLKRAKAELLETDLLTIQQGHWINSDGKKSEKHITSYRLLE